MATRTSQLRLTRDQLATFLGGHELIRAFENLFAVVDTIAPDVVQQVMLETGTAQAAATQSLAALQQTAQDASVAIAAADAKATQALQAVESLRAAVELVTLAPPKVPIKRSRYGQFFSTATQTAALPDTAYAITYNVADLSYGVGLSAGSSSRIEVDTEGIYDFQFSVQIDKTSGGTGRFWIWPRLNGVDATNSASEVQIQGNDAEIFSAANFFFDLKAGDYVEFMFAVSDVSVQMLSRPAAGVVPGIPSIILTVSNNIRSYP